MRYVIIGNSTAAVGCVEGIRQLDREGSITLVSEEPYHTYSRPLISYLLRGETDRQRMKYRPDGFYEENRCELLTGVSVCRIIPEEHKALLSDGRTLEYEKLLMATGSRPFVPPIEGIRQVEKRFTFQSLDDALRLGAALTPNSRVLIMGAGLIGLKCAEGIRHLAQNVTVVDLADHILSSILDVDAAKRMQDHIEKQGVDFLLSDGVERFEGNTAALKSGTRLPFDILVVAVGVSPNIELIAEAGGKTGRGIMTDTRCATTLPDVFAAGDCSESLDITTGQSRVLALLPNAYLQGECAGINMAGGDSRYDRAIPMNSIGFFGLHVATAGSPQGKALLSKDGDAYKKLFVQDDLLKGYMMVGDVSRCGIYTAMIRNRTPLSSVDFALIREKPQLMAFSKVERNKMLGGAEDED
ncbi:MAG: NAD(P)/FAD-dependent oxidoreductase [Clostridiales bacterium]|nr:NAD(P)/FAD-dependent oxidoreductase [Clostridiales bacterium]